MHHFALIIDGETIHADQRSTIEVTNPATGELLGRLPCATEEDLDRAAVSAAREFAAWKGRSSAQRGEILRKAAQITRENEQKLAQVITLEQGKPLAEALAEVSGIYEALEWFAEEGRRSYGRIVPSSSSNVEFKVQQVPVGPVLILTPWNFPVGEVANHLAPALAAGCTAVVKAAEEAPSATAMLVDILHEAGVPHGAVNLVFGDPAMIAKHLINSPVIRKIAFTGSVPVGKQLAALAGATMKSTTLELGGNAPAIVFDDVNLESVVSQIAYRKFRNSGQVCTTPNRIFVERTVFDRFVELMAARARSLKVGPGSEAGTEMGPLVSTRRLDAVLALVEDAVRGGGTLVFGGRRIGNSGCFMEPTVLANVPENLRTVREEIFGPVAVINHFSDVNDVIQRSNSVPVGLASYVFTRSLSRARAVSESLQFGMVGINTLAIASVEYPFGGVKDSGLGRVGGIEGLKQFLEIKSVTTDFSD
ncbi:NAD-dependent succinate-semialdehyde dehydrogenase (plasmid) [Mesorhizobium sp. ORM8.1]